MNANKGGVPTPQKDTYYPPECLHKHKIGLIQELNYTKKIVVSKGKKAKTIIEVIPKGIKIVLAKQGCLSIGSLLKAKCSQPRYANSLTYPAKKTNTSCCLARILANHKDFFKQKSALKEILLAKGYKCLFLPKFHCELNPIKMY
jgi:hypothetical protein